MKIMSISQKFVDEIDSVRGIIEVIDDMYQDRIENDVPYLLYDFTVWDFDVKYRVVVGTKNWFTSGYKLELRDMKLKDWIKEIL